MNKYLDRIETVRCPSVELKLEQLVVAQLPAGKTLRFQSSETLWNHICKLLAEVAPLLSPL